MQRVGEHSEDITENRDEKLLIKRLCNIRPVCAARQEWRQLGQRTNQRSGSWWLGVHARMFSNNSLRMLSPSSLMFRSVCLKAHMIASIVVRKTSGEACAKCISAGKQCLLIDSISLLRIEPAMANGETDGLSMRYGDRLREIAQLRAQVVHKGGAMHVTRQARLA